MIVSPTWAGKRYAVLGLARSGAATVRALVAGGASVVAWDADEARRVAIKPLPFRGGVGVGAATNAGLRESPTPNPSPEGEGLLEVADLDTLDLAGFDALVVSPGVPLNTHPLAVKARRAGVPIIGDIELFAEARTSLPPHKVVGITGTNGKSTTTALVTHILKTAGVPALMGGNIGLPILGVEPLPEGGVYVLELSSYQIDLTQSLDCDVAVLTNITPDHLDRYGGFEAYAASKMRLFGMQDQAKGQLAVVSEPWPVRPEFEQAIPNWSIWWTDKDDHRQEQAFWPSLQGPHNHQNASLAYAVCSELGLNAEQIYAALRTFTGLPHRMQMVGRVAGVAYVDDSKATNPESVAPALAAFTRVHWILGGRAKGADLDACKPAFGHVVRAYTIGEAGPVFAGLLRGQVEVEEVGTLDAAVERAAALAQPGETVLLSPAAASFDQFSDYEDRGRAFRRAVERLNTSVGAGA